RTCAACGAARRARRPSGRGTRSGAQQTTTTGALSPRRRRRPSRTSVHLLGAWDSKTKLGFARRREPRENPEFASAGLTCLLSAARDEVVVLRLPAHRSRDASGWDRP